MSMWHYVLYVLYNIVLCMPSAKCQEGAADCPAEAADSWLKKKNDTPTCIWHLCQLPAHQLSRKGTHDARAFLVPF
jgi:hypothetical protein